MMKGFFDVLVPVRERPPLCIAPVDYIDFWHSLLSFGRSLKNSDLVSYNGVYFRKRSQQLYLCTYDVTGPEVLEVLSELKHKHDYKIKCWNMVHKDFTGLPVKKSVKEWYVDASYCLDYVAGKKTQARSSKVVNKYHRGAEAYTTSTDFTHSDVLDLFKQWKEFAAPRHFMVVSGHYLEYIKQAYQPGSGIRLLGFYNNSTGALFGVAGWEVGANGNAQFTFMKHLPGDNNFSTYFWIRSIEEVLKDKTVKKVFCGSTADDLKERIEMTPEISYKIDMTGI